MNIDPTFETNDFNEPMILSKNRTTVNNILMLLFGKEGFYPTLPTIGINIQQYLYKFEDEVNVEEITSKIANQCSDFLPEVVSGDISITKRQYKGHLMLVIQLPIIDDESQSICAIAITTDDSGAMKYNFVHNEI